VSIVEATEESGRALHDCINQELIGILSLEV
jgi:hypothetical protein